MNVLNVYLWHLPNHVKWYYFTSMVNEQSYQQKPVAFLSLRSPTVHSPAVFVYLSHLMVPYVQNSTSHQACLPGTI